VTFSVYFDYGMTEALDPIFAETRACLENSIDKISKSQTWTPGKLSESDKILKEAHSLFVASEALVAEAMAADAGDRTFAFQQLRAVTSTLERVTNRIDPANTSESFRLETVKRAFLFCAPLLPLLWYSLRALRRRYRSV
jgi:hypothetical protein